MCPVLCSRIRVVIITLGKLHVITAARAFCLQGPASLNAFICGSPCDKTVVTSISRPQLDNGMLHKPVWRTVEGFCLVFAFCICCTITEHCFLLVGSLFCLTAYSVNEVNSLVSCGVYYFICLQLVCTPQHFSSAVKSKRKYCVKQQNTT